MSEMIRHVVVWTLKPQADGRSGEENAKLLKQELEGLVGKIPEIRFLQVGKNIVTAEGAWDVVLIVDFESLADLHAYQDHPAHQKVKALVGRIRDMRATVDFEY